MANQTLNRQSIADISKRITAAGLWLILTVSAHISAASSSHYPANPVLSGNAAYVSHHGVMRFDLVHLRPSWHALTGVATDHPVVDEHTLLVGSRSGLYALEPASGAVRWHFNVAERLFSPTLADGRAYVGSETGGLRAFDIASGRMLWERRFEGWIYSPAILGKRLIVGGQALQLHALDMRTGTTLWTLPLDQESVYRPVAVDHDTAIVTTFSGAVTALDVSAVQPRWRVQDQVANFSPVVVAGRLYFGTFAGDLKVRDLYTGQLLWQQSVRSSSAPVTVSDHTIFTTDLDRRLLIFDATTGILHKRHIIGEESVGSPLLLDEQRVLVFTVSRDSPTQLRPTVIRWPSVVTGSLIHKFNNVKQL